MNTLLWLALIGTRRIKDQEAPIRVTAVGTRGLKRMGDLLGSYTVDRRCIGCGCYFDVTLLMTVMIFDEWGKGNALSVLRPSSSS